MTIEIGDSTATVRSKINTVLTNAGLNAADNVDTTAATTLLNQVATLWSAPVTFVDRMPEADFRTAFALLESYQPLMPIGTLLEPFESTSGYTSQNGQVATLDSTLAVQGTYATRFNQVSGLGNVEYYKTFNAFDPQTLGKMAFYAHFDDDYDWQTSTSAAWAIRLLGAGSIYNLATRTGTDPGQVRVSAVGGQWIGGALSLADPAVQAAAAGNHQMRFRSSPGNAKVGNIAFDAAYYGVGGKSLVTLSWDDARADAYNIAFPIMAPLGLVGDLALPTANVETGGTTLTWAQVAALHAAGWGVSIDGTPDDTRMTDKASVAAVIAGLESQNNTLVSRGFARSKSFVYPNGSWKTDGTRTEKTSVAAAGTSTLTMADTTGITAGMRVIMFGASRTARVESVPNGTTVLLAGGETIPTFTGPAAFVNDSGPFHGFKMQRALLDAGYITGRTTNLGSWFTKFGLAPNQNIMHPGNSTTALTFANAQAIVNSAVAKGEDVDLYFHFVGSTSGSGLNMPEPDFSNFMAWLASQKSAGILDVVTYDQRQKLRNVGVPS